jgi:sulfide:quinone oxidoreductase
MKTSRLSLMILIFEQQYMYLCSITSGDVRVAIFDDMGEMPYDLFLGIPKHCVPAVVAASGMTVDGWIPVDQKTLKTRFPSVYSDESVQR